MSSSRKLTLLSLLLVLLPLMGAAEALAQGSGAPSPPSFTATDPASPANDNGPRIRGNAPAGTTVDLYTDSGCLTSVARGSAEAFADPGISVRVSNDSTTTFYATAADDSGNRSACSLNSVTYVEDSTAPDTTITGGPTGTSGRNPSFTFSSSEPNSDFECKLDDGQFEDCDSPKSYSNLSEGPHTFAVRAIDGAGNVDASPATRAFTVDSTVPETNITSGPNGATNDTSPTFAFTSSEPNSTFQCKLDEGDFEPCASPKTYGTTVPLAPGSHTFQVRAIDPGGNVDPTPATRTFTVDTDAPETTVTGGPSGSTSNRTAEFTFTSDEPATFRCKLDDGEYETCSSPETYPNLSDGSHTFSVKAVDAAGNEDASPATRTFTVDSGAPQTTIDSGPSGPTNQSTVTFAFSSSESGSTFMCRLDGPGPAPGAFEPCTSPRTHSNLADGEYTFSVKAVDAADNEDATPAVRTFTVDTSVPNTTIDSGPADGSTVVADSVPFSFSSADGTATFECRLDGGEYQVCSSPRTFDSLSEGPHTFQVRAVDAAGNRDASPATRSFTYKRPAQTTINSGPSGATKQNSATFTFSSDQGDATFRCKLDDAPFSDCSSPKTYSNLSDGSHTFTVQAVDAEGDADPTPASRTFTVDTAAPNTTITSGPSGPTRRADASFAFSSNEGGATFRCKLDNGTYQSCSSPKAYANLSDGRHTFTVKAVDAAGNEDPTPATRTFTVDTDAPEVTIDSGPSGAIDEDEVRFTFSSGEAGTTFECKLDAGDYEPCSSPKTYSDLRERSHSFRVRARDAAGNVGPSRGRAFRVDTTPPEITDLTAEPNPFDISDDGRLTIRYRVDEPTGGYRARTEIQDARNDTLLTVGFTNRNRSGAIEHYWTGGYEDGGTVPAGRYFVKATVIDTAGNRTVQRIRVRVTP